MSYRGYQTWCRIKLRVVVSVSCSRLDPQIAFGRGTSCLWSRLARARSVLAAGTQAKISGKVYSYDLKSSSSEKLLEGCAGSRARQNNSVPPTRRKSAFDEGE